MPLDTKGTPAQVPLTPAQWAAAVDPESGRLRGGGLQALGQVRLGGCANSIRAQVWPFLLGIDDPSSTSTEREEQQRKSRKRYEELRKIARVVSERAQQEDERRSAQAEATLARQRKQQEAEKKERASGGRQGAAEGADGGEAHARGGTAQGVLVAPEPAIGVPAVIQTRRKSEGGERAGEAVPTPMFDGRGRVAWVEGEDEGKGEAEEEEEDVFCDAVELDSPPHPDAASSAERACAAAGLESSTGSFVDVTHSDAAVPGERLSGGTETASGAPGDGSGASIPGAVLSRSNEGTSGAAVLGEGHCGGTGPTAGAPRGSQSSEQGVVFATPAPALEMDEEWVTGRLEIPEMFQAASGEGAGSSGLENFVVWRRIMRLDAVRMNSQWLPFSADTEFSERQSYESAAAMELRSHEHLAAAQRAHAARLVGILEAYAVADPEIGYCQGMTDLLSPFVALCVDDSDAFCCFQRFMETARHNFRTDEVGIRKQLDFVSRVLKHCDPEVYNHLKVLNAEDCLFVYRMVVVLLRRELSFEQTISLWEVLWAEAATAAAADTAAAAAASVGASVVVHHGYSAAPARSDFFLFVIAAIVVTRRKAVLACGGLDEVLRLCNSLAGQLDVWGLVGEARKLVCAFTWGTRG